MVSPRTFRNLASFGLALIALAACSDDSTAQAEARDPAEVASNALLAAEQVPLADRTAATTTTTSLAGPLDPTSIPGAVIDQYSLQVGDCFDRIEDLQAGRPVTITTRLDCDDPHEFQIFHRLIYGPAPHPTAYPGDAIMRDFALQSCYRLFSFWVGAEYEVSVLDIGVLTPNRTNFENDLARYRGIHCWVHRVDGEPLVGDARGSGL